jgi:hypothetical protein
VGVVFDPFHEARKPKLVLAPADRLPFQAALRAVTVEPLLVTVAPQAFETVWPLAYVQVTVQFLIAALPAVTLTSPWKPPGHWPVTA